MTDYTAPKINPQTSLLIDVCRAAGELVVKSLLEVGGVAANRAFLVLRSGISFEVDRQVYWLVIRRRGDDAP